MSCWASGMWSVTKERFCKQPATSETTLLKLDAASRPASVHFDDINRSLRLVKYYLQFTDTRTFDKWYDCYICKNFFKSYILKLYFNNIFSLIPIFSNINCQCLCQLILSDFPSFNQRWHHTGAPGVLAPGQDEVEAACQCPFSTQTFNNESIQHEIMTARVQASTLVAAINRVHRQP